MLLLNSCILLQLVLVSPLTSLAANSLRGELDSSQDVSDKRHSHKAILHQLAASGADVKHGNKVPLGDISPEYHPHALLRDRHKSKDDADNDDSLDSEPKDAFTEVAFEIASASSSFPLRSSPTGFPQLHLPQQPPSSAALPLPNVATHQSPLTAPSTPSDTCAILYKIYIDMNGTSWVINHGWSSGALFKSISPHSTSTPASSKHLEADSDRSLPDCCDWYGVTCNKESTVTALDLAGNGLSGPISSWIFSLPDLQRLNLSSNALGGSVPNTFDALPSLKSLDLSSTSVTGEIPVTLSSHPELSTLHLSNNQLTRTVTFSAPGLVNLLLDNNLLDGLTINVSAGLVRLTANDNQIEGPLPDLSAATGLQIFNVAGNRFTGTLFDLSQLQQLDRFDVHQNQLSGPFPNDVSGLVHLTTFILSSNEFSGSFPSTLAPSSLKSCSVLPNDVQVVPPTSVLVNPDSLANRCGIKAPPSGSTMEPEAGKRDVEIGREQDEQEQGMSDEWEGQMFVGEMNDDEQERISTREEEEGGPLITTANEKREVKANMAVRSMGSRIETRVMVGVGVSVLWCMLSLVLN